MTSTGKIARLPKHIREQLNQRLEDGQTAEDILPWLNRVPACKKVLAEKFNGRPISRQNLSQWKCGGYQTWLRTGQAREHVQSLVEQAEDLEKDSGNPSIADRIATVLSVQLLAATQQLDTIKDPKERWHNLKDILRELSRLRREDHHARRVHLAEEQWTGKRRRQAEQDEKDRKKAEKGRLIGWALSLFTKKESIESYGGGEMGRRWADWFHRVENDLPLPKWFPGPWADTHFGPDGANWSNISLPNESKGSSSSSSSQNTKCPPSAEHDSNKGNSAKSAPSQSSEPSAAVPSPDTRHSSPSTRVKVNQSKSKSAESSQERGHSCPQQLSTPDAPGDTNSDESEPRSTPDSSNAQKPIALNPPPP